MAKRVRRMKRDAVSPFRDKIWRLVQETAKGMDGADVVMALKQAGEEIWAVGIDDTYSSMTHQDDEPLGNAFDITWLTVHVRSSRTPGGADASSTPCSYHPATKTYRCRVATPPTSAGGVETYMTVFEGPNRFMEGQHVAAPTVEPGKETRGPTAVVRPVDDCLQFPGVLASPEGDRTYHPKWNTTTNNGRIESGDPFKRRPARRR